MVSIFEFTSYRQYLQSWLANLGPKSHGMKGKVASALGISSSLVSQILKGEKNLTSDQASDLSDYMGLIEIEADYFQLLVEAERAGSLRYKEKLRRKLEKLREQSREIGKRVPRQRELTPEQQATYYSSWFYTAIHNLSGIPEFQNQNAIAARLQLEPQNVGRLLRFLIENGLCREEAGRITFGPASTHVDRDSPFVNQHHHNWRVQALQNMEKRRDQDLFFTSPLSLSHTAAEEIRKLLPSMIQDIMKIVAPSPSERVACLNIDWFEY